LSDVFAIVTVTNFYADLRIVESKISGIGLTKKKVEQGGEYQTFS